MVHCGIPMRSIPHKFNFFLIQCDGLADCCQITMILMSQAFPDMRIGDKSLREA